MVSCQEAFSAMCLTERSVSPNSSFVIARRSPAYPCRCPARDVAIRGDPRTPDSAWGKPHPTTAFCRPRESGDLDWANFWTYAEIPAFAGMPTSGAPRGWCPGMRAMETPHRGVSTGREDRDRTGLRPRQSAALPIQEGGLAWHASRSTKRTPFVFAKSERRHLSACGVNLRSTQFPRSSVGTPIPPIPRIAEKYTKG